MANRRVVDAIGTRSGGRIACSAMWG